jgi:hypothetical protein
LVYGAFLAFFSSPGLTKLIVTYFSKPFLNLDSSRFKPNYFWLTGRSAIGYVGSHFGILNGLFLYILQANFDIAQTTSFLLQFFFFKFGKTETPRAQRTTADTIGLVSGLLMPPNLITFLVTEFLGANCNAYFTKYWTISFLQALAIGFDMLSIFSFYA